jgi:hypothetical protein
MALGALGRAKTALKLAWRDSTRHAQACMQHALIQLHQCRQMLILATFQLLLPVRLSVCPSFWEEAFSGMCMLVRAQSKATDDRGIISSILYCSRTCLHLDQDRSPCHSSSA